MLTGLVALSTVLLAAAPAATPAPSAPPRGAAAAAPTPARPAAPPKRFASEPLAFSVAFPCDPPRQQTVGGEPEQGPVKVHVFMCGEQKGETAFGVSVMVPPAEGAKELANPEFIQALLQGLAAQIVKGTNGKVLREGAVRAGGVEGYETVVEGAGGRGRFRAFPHGGRVYQVIAIGAIDRAAEADAFVESFALDAK